MGTKRKPDPRRAVVTTREAAEILGVTPARVRQFITDGRLSTDARGSVSLLLREEVMALKRTTRAPGRPPAK